MNHHILIVGGAGYIGSHIAYHLHTLGYQVTILDSLRYGQSPNVVRQWGRVVIGDFGDRALLDALFAQYDFRGIVHCAALVEVGESVRDPGPFYANNVTKTHILLDAMRQARIKHIIYSSSCAVYGVPTQVPITEGQPFAPISPYGKTKVAVEYLLQDYAQAYDISYVALRYFNACGALPEVGLGEYHEPETHLIPLVLRAIHTGKPISIFGNDYDTIDGSPVRDYVHVRDIADAHVRSLHHLQTTGVSDCFNLGTGSGYSVKQIVDAAEKLCGKKALRVISQRRSGDPATLVAEAAHARQVLGWQPHFSGLDLILQSALGWEAQNHYFLQRQG